MRQQWAALAALSIGLSGLSQPAQSQEPLPAVSVRLGCHDEGAEATGTELDRMGDLLEFARAHDGQAVYLDAVIAANDGAGTCSRDLSEFPDQPVPEPFRAMITFDPCRIETAEGEAAQRCVRPGMVDVRAYGPPLAISNSIILPAQEDLPLSLPYRIYGYGDWLNYQGPFIVRYMSGTGYEYATFDVPDAALPGVWDRAGVNAATRPQD
ncbi:hypothetical protein [uncultured Brevundimonas sp.]|uniref:hypothetical protein n=1 Tax=uncultured Brevundimonas sp. TaxID=213418 RepID=UPI0030EC3A6F|tara:strand:+ start:20553 stop:21182 length:630 start_codon:yes stop_codon:yes gene_type:complete